MGTDKPTKPINTPDDRTSRAQLLHPRSANCDCHASILASLASRDWSAAKNSMTSASAFIAANGARSDSRHWRRRAVSISMAFGIAGPCMPPTVNLRGEPERATIGCTARLGGPLPGARVGSVSRHRHLSVARGAERLATAANHEDARDGVHRVAGLKAPAASAILDALPLVRSLRGGHGSPPETLTGALIDRTRPFLRTGDAWGDGPG